MGVATRKRMPMPVFYLHLSQIQRFGKDEAGRFFNRRAARIGYNPPIPTRNGSNDERRDGSPNLAQQSDSHFQSDCHFVAQILHMSLKFIEV